MERLICFCIGHRWRATRWIRYEPNRAGFTWWRRRYCERCGTGHTETVSTPERPLDVVEAAHAD